MAKPKTKRRDPYPKYPTVIDPRNFPKRRQSKYVKAMIERDQTVRDLRNQIHALEKAAEPDATNEKLLEYASQSLTDIERDLDILIREAGDLSDRAKQIAMRCHVTTAVIKRPHLLANVAHGIKGSNEH